MIMRSMTPEQARELLAKYPTLDIEGRRAMRAEWVGGEPYSAMAAEALFYTALQRAAGRLPTRDEIAAHARASTRWSDNPWRGIDERREAAWDNEWEAKT